MNEEVKEYLEPGKKNIVLIYILYLSGLMIPVLTLVGAAFAYANKYHVNYIWRTHYLFAFRTFYLSLIGFFLSFLINVSFIGLLVFVWFVIRSILALKFLFKGLPYPNPLTYWIK